MGVMNLDVDRTPGNGPTFSYLPWITALAALSLLACDSEDTVGGTGVGSGGNVGTGSVQSTGGAVSAGGGGTTGGTGSTPGTGGEVTGTGGDTGGGGNCDLTGTWALHKVTFTNAESALALNNPQKTSEWHYIAITQTGDGFVVDEGVPCGIATSGDASVVLNPDGMPTVQMRNETDGRTGTSIDNGTACDFTIERVYGLMSLADTNLPPDTVLPPGRVPGNPALGTLAALPMTAPGVEDWDNDGQPGMRYLLMDVPLLGSGWRDGAQRSWSQQSGPFAYGAQDFMIPITWDFDDVILAADIDLAKSPASPTPQANNAAKWKRIAAVAGSDPDKCAAVKALLPHSPTPKDAY